MAKGKGRSSGISVSRVFCPWSKRVDKCERLPSGLIKAESLKHILDMFLVTWVTIDHESDIAMSSSIQKPHPCWL